MDEGNVRSRDKQVTRIPVQTRAVDKRKRILNAAFELFSERGYEAVGMRDIAAAAGVSIGTTYAYFTDKKEVLIEVFDLYAEELRHGILEHIDAGVSDQIDLEEFVHGLIRRFFTIFGNREKLHRDVIIMSLADHRMQSVYAELERSGEEAMMNVFIGFFGDRIDLGDEGAARLVIHKTIDEIAQYLLFYEVPIDRDRVFRETARMIARYLEKR